MENSPFQKVGESKTARFEKENIMDFFKASHLDTALACIVHKQNRIVVFIVHKQNGSLSMYCS